MDEHKSMENIANHKAYWLETYGCQMNMAESAALEGVLKEKGLIPAGSPEEADMVILNTCSVRQTAEDRIYGRLGFYTALKKKKNFHLSVTGCMAERLGDKLKEKVQAVDSVIGMEEKGKLAGLLLPAHGGDYRGAEYGFHKNYGPQGAVKTFIPIMHGCDNFCSFCIVPYVRGREVSRDPADILNEIEYSIQNGVKEITLLGQNVNSYTFANYGTGEGALNFAGLLRLIAKEYSDDIWIRFLTSHPKDFSDDILNALAANPVFCGNIHLPVQHGSDKILAAMNRKYTREFYEKRIERIKAALPGVTLTTDIMVGFPGEEEEDFRELIDLMKSVGFTESFTYYYNPREGTKAWDLRDTVPHEVKIRRLQEIIALQKKIGTNLKKAGLGRVTRVLAEDISKKNPAELIGRTEGNEMVVFPAPASSLHTFVKIKLVTLRGNTFRGEIAL